MVKWGGKREGSGRPTGSGRFGGPTKAIRVPEAMVTQIYDYIQNEAFQLPLYGASVKAGFPSPADDYLEGALDLNNHLIRHPAATFVVRVSGNSMINAGIFNNDLLIVDRSLEPANGKIVIAVINGELTVKRFQKNARECLLVAENPEYPAIEIKPEDDLHIWGVVTNVIHHVL